MSCLFLPTLPHRKRELRHGVHEFLLNCADFEKHSITQLEFNVSLFVHMSLVFDEFLMSCVVHFSVHSQGHWKLESGMNF